MTLRACMVRVLAGLVLNFEVDRSLTQTPLAGVFSCADCIGGRCASRLQKKTATVKVTV